MRNIIPPHRIPKICPRLNAGFRSAESGKLLIPRAITKSFIIKSIATCFGAGYVPLAPGSVCTMLTALAWWHFTKGIGGLNGLAFVLVLIAVSIPVCTAAEKLFASKDDKKIVIDETAGFAVSVLFVPHEPALAIAAFAIFRFMDIVKPLYVKKIQKLPGGLGIVADDVLAGIYTNIILQGFNYVLH